MDGRISTSRGQGLTGSKGQATFDRLVMTAARMSHKTAFKLVVGSLGITAAADLATGTQVWLGPLYLLVICLATWSLGARSGLVVTGLCFSVTVLANGTDMYPFQGPLLAWNMAARAFAVLSMIVLVAAFRRSYVREWQRARVDQLTGTLTRNAFLEEVRGLGKDGGAAILAYVDLDDFKTINDNHGHAAGDDLLCLFSKTVLSHTRVSDRVGRVGGDEFLIYLAVADEQDGEYAIRAVHQRVNEALRQAGHPAGCSVGALFIEPYHPVTPADIARADQLMYRAKAQSRIVIIGPRHAAADHLLPSGGVDSPVRLDGSPDATQTGKLGSVRRRAGARW